MYKKIAFGMAILFFLVAARVNAAFLYIDSPVSQTEVGDTVTVTVKIDTEEITVNYADAVIKYNPDFLEVTQIKEVDPPEQFFERLIQKVLVSLKTIFLSGLPLADDPTKIVEKSGVGTFAQITLKALKEGSTEISFDCTQGATTDTNIVKTVKTGQDVDSVEDIIDCEKTVGITLNIAPNDTTPTIDPSISPSGEPTGMPRTRKVCPEDQDVMQGDIDCNGEIDLRDFEVWRQDYEEGYTDIAEFEVFRAAYLKV